MTRHLAALGAVFTLALGGGSLSRQPPAESPREETRGPITIRVVDESGAPVKGAEVGSFAMGEGEEGTGRLVLGFDGRESAAGVVTDDHGLCEANSSWIFQGPDDVRPRAMIAWTADRSKIGLAELSPDRAGPVEIRLSPACLVTVKATSTGLRELGRDLIWSNVYVNWGQTRPFGVDSRNGVQRFILPPGEYKLHVYGTDTYTRSPALVIGAGERERIIEADLPPTRLARITGGPAPELSGVRAWRGGEPVTLADLHGKVVILDFWGYWCGPCVAGMPKLVELHDKYKDRGLVIIAVHDDTGESVEEVLSQCEKVRDESWGGRELPFRLALDGGGMSPIEGTDLKTRGLSTAAYGVRSFPTTVLIDRSGTVVGRLNAESTGGVARLERLLDGEK